MKYIALILLLFLLQGCFILVVDGNNNTLNINDNDNPDLSIPMVK